MKFFMIVDESSGNIWSRNGWKTPTSTPDLYQTKKAAEYQTLGDGKMFYISKYLPNIRPLIIPVKLVKV